MHVAEGPWTIRGRGYAVVMALASGERANVGDRLRRADGATWTLSGVESGAVAERCILTGDAPPRVGDELTVLPEDPGRPVRGSLPADFWYTTSAKVNSTKEASAFVADIRRRIARGGGPC